MHPAAGWPPSAADLLPIQLEGVGDIMEGDYNPDDEP